MFVRKTIKCGYIRSISIACELMVVNEQFEMEISLAIVKALNARDGKYDQIVVFRMIKYSMLSFLSA